MPASSQQKIVSRPLNCSRTRDLVCGGHPGPGLEDGSDFQAVHGRRKGHDGLDSSHLRSGGTGSFLFMTSSGESCFLLLCYSSKYWPVFVVCCYLHRYLPTCLPTCLPTDRTPSIHPYRHAYIHKQHTYINLHYIHSIPTMPRIHYTTLHTLQ